jgi:hypothetical protein
MNVAVVLVVFSVIGFLVLLIVGKGRLFARKTDTPRVSELQPIDVEAFRNLIDEKEEAYLREHLSGCDFRRVHRERMLAAVDYVVGAYRNAGILVALAQAARDAADPQVAAAAEKLFENAVRMRLYAIQVIPRLYLSMLLPGASHAPRIFFDRYDTLSREALVLRSLGSPLRNG